MREDTFHWLDVERIAEELAIHHPEVDPLELSFTQLSDLVTRLPGFLARPGHNVNERILETIQSLWHDERGDDDRE
jgi:FeS assembly protein IscX